MLRTFQMPLLFRFRELGKNELELGQLVGGLLNIKGIFVLNSFTQI